MSEPTVAPHHATRPPEPFAFTETVRFRHLDALGHVNNTEFLRFLESARLAYVQRFHPGTSLLEAGLRGFILAENHIAYRSPVFIDEEVRTTLWPSEVRRSSVRLAFEMHVVGDGRLTAEGSAVLVAYDFDANRTMPIPEPIRELLVADTGS